LHLVGLLYIIVVIGLESRVRFHHALNAELVVLRFCIKTIILSGFEM